MAMAALGIPRGAPGFPLVLLAQHDRPCGQDHVSIAPLLAAREHTTGCSAGEMPQLPRPLLATEGLRSTDVCLTSPRALTATHHSPRQPGAQRTQERKEAQSWLVEIPPPCGESQDQP